MYYKLNAIYQTLYFMINVKVFKILAEETVNFKMTHNEQIYLYYKIHTDTTLRFKSLEYILIN